MEDVHLLQMGWRNDVGYGVGFPRPRSRRVKYAVEDREDNIVFEGVD